MTRLPASSATITAYSVTCSSARAYAGRSLAGAASTAATTRVATMRPAAAGSPTSRVGGGGVATGAGDAVTTSDGALLAELQPMARIAYRPRIERSNAHRVQTIRSSVVLQN